VVAQSTAQGSTTLTVVDATSFPSNGILEIVPDPNNPQSVMRVGYSKSDASNTLFLAAPLDRSVPQGAEVRSAQAPAVLYESVAQGAGCEIPVTTTRTRGELLWGSVALAVVLLRRRSR
jgi:hypothetical protein